MAEQNTGTAYDVGGENKRVVPFTIQQREWLSKFHNIGILFFNTITTLRLVTDHQTDMVTGCFENFAIYSYDNESMDVDDGENFLRPNNVDQYTAGRWVLRAKFDGGNIELKFYDLRADFPAVGGETYLYIDKSNGRLYRWSNFVGEYIGMSVNYSLDSGMLGGQLPVYYKDVMQVNSLPLDNQLTTVIYELLQQDGDKAPYTLWAWDGLQWNGVGGSTSETDPLFQQWLLTADIVESVTSTDNHIVVDNADPKNPSLSFQLVDNENLLTDDELEVVQATSGTNTGDQVGDGVTITGAGTIEDPFVAASITDIDNYLLKDTTLQAADTPENTSLFSFWKIGVGRVKIAWSDLLNAIRHNQLMGLSWLDSGHTGTANKLFGSDANGLAKEYIRDSFATSSASSGTITLVENQSLTLTTTLTNAHTLTITPTVPTTFDPPRWEELLFTVGATLPSITWTEPSGVTFEYADKAFSVAFTANKKVMILYKWISSTRCIIRRNEY